MAKLLKIDVFTDVVCPWCLVGSARLDQALANLPNDIEVEVENHPFYLDPTVPAEGVDVGEMLKEKYGRDPKEMWERVESEAAKAGITLDLSQQPRMFNTAKAHTLTRRRGLLPRAPPDQRRQCSRRYRCRLWLGPWRRS
jgi:predicted DsbA family dithiol-disulfide isomerase